MHKRYINAVKITFVLSLLVGLFLPQSASALSGSQFSAGRIIDDANFFNGNTMTASQIQTFLNAKVPVCDTNGTQPYGGTTRKAYAASRGVSTPFICLKDYRMNTPSKAGESGLCAAISAKTNRTAAQIIDDVSRACGVGQKSLLVLLQKEQALVTDDWPWPIQYRSATGYGCPDTAPCDSEYYGFFNQVYNAARQFKRYAADPTFFNHRPGANNSVRYHPNSNCGSRTVYIQNQATAGLYNYTPYQPNAAALNNLYGTGDTCSSYGNRNFWRLYYEWFGNPVGPGYSATTSSIALFYDSGLTDPVAQADDTYFLKPGQTAYARVRVINSGRNVWYQNNARLGTVFPNDRPSVFATNTWPSNHRPAIMSEASVDPGETATFTFRLTAPSTYNNYIESFRPVFEGVSWASGDVQSIRINNVKPLLDSELNQPSVSTLSVNETLYPGERLSSPDGNTILHFQRNGNVELYKNFKLTWQSNTKGRNANRLVNQSDGNLVLYFNSTPLWNSNTTGRGSGNVVLQTDGNLVLYSTTQGATWSSNTAGPDQRDIVNVSFSSTGYLFPNQYLFSPDRKRVLVLQNDGNLVLYSSSRAVWSSRTTGKQISHLVLQNDGNLVLYSTSGPAVWSTRTSTKSPTRLILQQDGNLVLYTGSQARWQSGTANR